MIKLILSDITIMGAGYCVLGLEQTSPDSYRSVRPMPPFGFAWREPFPLSRGDQVNFVPRPTRTVVPHIEDKNSFGLSGTGSRLAEEALVLRLKKAEAASDLAGLFGCAPQTGSRGGGAFWVDPTAARRSVCGCDYESLQFRVFPEPNSFTLRAELVMPSSERIKSIPIVDRDWRRFVENLVRRSRRTDPLPLIERFLNRVILLRMMSSPNRFARIGLPRPHETGQCWLMLDSLFPQALESWLDLF